MNSNLQASGAFPHTRWSIVVAARGSPSPESAAALETICRIYWYPLYAYLRRCGKSSHDAQDLTQEFFRQFLEKRWLDLADPEKGRLRTFLIVALKRFTITEWRRASTQRRGWGQFHLQMDTAFAESRYAADSNTELPPDEAFDYQWALALHDATVERLRTEFDAAGKCDEFDKLKDSLMAARGEINYAVVAARLNVSEGAVRVAVHRLRKRFRQIYREAISDTLLNGQDVETEVRHLAQILART